MTDDPWAGLNPSLLAASVNARRVDTACPWNFFWALDHRSRPGLVLRHALPSIPAEQIPNLRGLEVFSATDNVDAILALTLLEPDHKDIFLTLCRDIQTDACAAASESEAVARLLARTWRWHHLLRGGTDARLSVEEQRGLLGELAVFERFFLEEFAPADAVAAWRGPLAAPKDFEFAASAVECKATRPAAAPSVTISSEHQLDTSRLERLWLCVTRIEQASPDQTGARDIASHARSLRRHIETTDAAAAARFAHLLEAAGLRAEHDYSNTLWIVGPTEIYCVEEEFPRIEGSGIASGISHVSYNLLLSACATFGASPEEFRAGLRRNRDG